MPDADVVEVERATQRALRVVEDAEMRLMPDGERSAVNWSFGSFARPCCRRSSGS